MNSFRKDTRIIGVVVFLTAVLCSEVRSQQYVPESLPTGLNWSPDSRKLAFSIAESGNYDIYVVDIWENRRERITEHPANDLYPAWSPDGQNIAFYSDREPSVPPFPPDTIIYKVRGLHEAYARDGYKPSWSPDGRKIAAHLRSERGNYEIYIMNEQARKRQPLTWNMATDVHPRFSPDGKKIVFISDRDFQPELYVLDVRSKKQIRLTYSPAYDLDPLWSPDGKKIAFISNESVSFDIYVIDADGQNKKRLTNSPSYDLSPVWSPDGKQILFSSDRSGYFDLYIMNSDGSGIRKLTSDKKHEYYGCWSPDGERIAFLSKEEEVTNLYIMKPDGSRKKKLFP